MIVVRTFDAEGDADAIADALVDSSIHHAQLEPARYRVLDRAVVAAAYRHGRQHPSGPPEDRETLVAELDGQVVGVIDVHVADPGGAHKPLRYGYVAELAVAAHARRQGAGAALLAAAEAWSRSRDCSYSVLDFNIHNVDADRFYGERMGYRPAGSIVIKNL